MDFSASMLRQGGVSGGEDGERERELRLEIMDSCQPEGKAREESIRSSRRRRSTSASGPTPFRQPRKRQIRHSIHTLHILLN